MIPTIVHRYSIPTADALRTLLDISDCEKVDVFIIGENLVFDVIAPAAETPGQKPGSAAQAQDEEKPDFPAAEQSGETSPGASEQTEPELKGGPLARRAAMMCQERGFWTFSETGSAEEAADWLREICGVTSRAMLDHDERAAGEFNRIDGRYRLWIAGYDD